jgi:hypothetical protein
VSMDRCSNCDRLVDTDYDPDFYELQVHTEGHCEFCRERMSRDRDEDERLDDPRHGQAESINQGRY